MNFDLGYVVQVIAGINQKLQLLVDEAQALAASGGSDTAVTLLGLQTQISKLASVQQEQVLPQVAILAEKLAADPAYDASVDIAVFTDVSRLCHGMHGMCVHAACQMCTAHPGCMCMGCGVQNVRTWAARAGKETGLGTDVLNMRLGGLPVCLSASLCTAAPVILRTLNESCTLQTCPWLFCVFPALACYFSHRTFAVD